VKADSFFRASCSLDFPQKVVVWKQRNPPELSVYKSFAVERSFRINAVFDSLLEKEISDGVPDAEFKVKTKVE
jgi:hypothetical protein